MGHYEQDYEYDKSGQREKDLRAQPAKSPLRGIAEAMGRAVPGGLIPMDELTRGAMQVKIDEQGNQIDEHRYVDNTLAARGERYGKFNGVAQITQAIKAEMRATPNWDSLSSDKKEALEMIAQKIARILNGDPNYHDSWHDIAGYAELVASALQGVQK